MKDFNNKLKKWLPSSWLLARTRTLIRKIVKSIITFRRSTVVNFNNPQKSLIFDLVIKTAKETEMLLSYDEAYELYTTAVATRKIKGEMATVGIYKGASAKILSEAKGERPLHLFDTFEGHVNVGENDPPYFYNGQYKSSVKEVKEYLRHYQHLYFYKGIFPETGRHIADKTFSFVYIDVDTYQSTLDCLTFFYPRLEKGGILMSHDYTAIKSVNKTINQFFKNKPEPIIEMSGSQCIVVKI